MTTAPTAAQIDDVTTALGMARDAHAQAHNAAFAAGKGRTCGATDALYDRLDALRLAYGHVCAGRTARTSYTPATFVDAALALASDCDAYTASTGINAPNQTAARILASQPRTRR